MERLPPDIQLMIIEKLGVLDIFHLQQTCKTLYQLIEAFDQTIWRKCLQLQCSQNRMFWPSYRDHVASHELKDACTASFRFRKATGNWEPQSEGIAFIPSVSKKLVLDSDPALEDFYLIPGGRFLITLHKFKLRVWNLYPSPSWKKGPEAVGYTDVYCMQDPFASIAYANVVDCTKVQLILDGTTESEHDGQQITSMLYMELTIGEGPETTFSAGEPVLLRLLHPEDEETPNFTMAGDGTTVVFQTTCGITVAWDSTRNHCIGWRPDGLGEESYLKWELFSNDKFIFYVTGAGIHGFEIPPLRPITGENVDLLSFSGNLLPPTFFLPHTGTYDIGESGYIVGPDACFPITDQQPVVYIIQEKNDLSSTFRLHWYQFRFNSSDPQSSTLTLLRTSSPDREYESDLAPFVNYYTWGDQVAIVWELEYEDDDSNDEDEVELAHSSFYLSLSSMPRSPNSSAAAHTHIEEESLTIVRFARYPVTQHDDSVPVPLSHGLCLHTGMAVVHCWVPSDDIYWIDCYDLAGDFQTALSHQEEKQAKMQDLICRT